MQPQWIAPTSTMLGVLMAGISTSIVLIAPPPTAALFTACLGYNPVTHTLPPAVLTHLSPAFRAHLIERSFFPRLIGPSLMEGLRFAFCIAADMSLIAAIASQLRGAGGRAAVPAAHCRIR